LSVAIDKCWVLQIGKGEVQTTICVNTCQYWRPAGLMAQWLTTIVSKQPMPQYCLMPYSA